VGERLSRLQHHLDDLGFSKENRDPMYQLFIEKMYEVRSQPIERLLSEDELKAQEALAEEVAKALVKKERADNLSALAQELKVSLGG
jgi:predicted DNA-binding transcriptional regulator